MGASHSHALYVHEHSRVHRLPPQAKVAAAVAFVVMVAVTPRQVVWAFGLHAAALIAVILIARIPGRFVLVRLLGILPFVAFALLIPFIASGEMIEFAGISLSRDGLWAAWNILAKASLGATTSIVLTATTEVPDLLAGLTRLRVPAALTSIAGFMIRYLELIGGELARMRVAMASRGYRPRWLWQGRPLAAAAGTLFVRSYERGERVYDAMLARGFTGSMPDLRHHHPSPSDWAAALALPGYGLVVLVAAWVIA